MKLKKIMLTILAIFLGINCVYADEDEGSQYEKEFLDTTYSYEFYSNIYQIFGTISHFYFHSAVYDPNATVGADPWDTALSLFQMTDHESDLSSIYQVYSQNTHWSSAYVRSVMSLAYKMVKDKYKLTVEYDDDACGSMFHDTSEASKAAKSDCAKFRDDLSNNTDFAGMVVDSQNFLSKLVVACKDSDGDPKCSDYISKYDALIEDTTQRFENVCDYLDNHPGVSYYLRTALQLVSYAALALAVILGALDFIKAITSNDDAALTKAFQSFVKRLVAVVLIFLTYLIVQLIMGLIPRMPGATANYVQMCDQLKIGGIGG